jgi:membrane protease YdiL (CAAX protease family)
MTQGVAGVVLTGMVGLGLGIIMVWRRSYWEAALAHGIFNASSIVALWAVQRFFPEQLKQALTQ